MFGGVFEELFSPGRKHTSDEHNRLTLARDDDHEDGGPGPIDLDKGIVVIRRPAPAPVPSTPAADAEAGATGSSDSADAGQAPERSSDQ